MLSKDSYNFRNGASSDSTYRSDNEGSTCHGREAQYWRLYKAWYKLTQWLTLPTTLIMLDLTPRSDNGCILDPHQTWVIVHYIPPRNNSKTGIATS